MTLRYSDINQHDALYKAARQYPGGIEALAQRMGISVNVLRNKLSPGISTHYPSFEEVSEITEFLVDAKVPDALLPIHALNWRHRLATFPVPEVDHVPDEQLAQTLCRAMKEFGDVAACVSDYLSQERRISKADQERAEKEFKEAFGALSECLFRIRLRSAGSGRAY